jgi:hypothetical protein
MSEVSLVTAAADGRGPIRLDVRWGERHLSFVAKRVELVGPDETAPLAKAARGCPGLLCCR